VIVGATPLPVSADLENGCGDEPKDAVVSAVDRPVNAIIMPGGPTVPEMFEAGAMRVSIGSAICAAAQSAIIAAGRELLGEGTHQFWSNAVADMGTVLKALAPPD
jgi:2-methylisocitrate lyase-like PEP mutase family enzyme